MTTSRLVVVKQPTRDRNEQTTDVPVNHVRRQEDSALAQDDRSGALSVGDVAGKVGASMKSIITRMR